MPEVRCMYRQAAGKGGETPILDGLARTTIPIWTVDTGLSIYTVPASQGQSYTAGWKSKRGTVKHFRKKGTWLMFGPPIHWSTVMPGGMLPHMPGLPAPDQPLSGGNAAHLAFGSLESTHSVISRLQQIFCRLSGVQDLHDICCSRDMTASSSFHKNLGVWYFCSFHVLLSTVHSCRYPIAQARHVFRHPWSACSILKHQPTALQVQTGWISNERTYPAAERGSQVPKIHASRSRHYPRQGECCRWACWRWVRYCAVKPCRCLFPRRAV